MEQEAAKKPLPPLTRQPSTYKLIVPEDVEEKIRYLIHKFPHTEWSGVLFYSHTGSFETDDLVITCRDIYPMDLGSAGFTEFKMTPDVSHYIAENIDLFDCEIGNIHSHHTLGAFFSGTDESTLQDGGNDVNCWLMLIVDTQGKYVARITRKVKVEKEITVKNIDSSYEFFGEDTVKKDIDSTMTKNVCNEEIQYFDLDVERHVVPNRLSFLDDRFEEIQAEKLKNIQSHANTSNFQPVKPLKPNEPVPIVNSHFNNNDYYNLSHPWEGRKQNAAVKKQEDDNYVPDPKLIHRAVCTMITCSFILSIEKFDLKQWITKYMVNTYERIFNDDAAAFDEWKEFIVSFLVYHFEDVSASAFLDDEYYYSAVAQAMVDELFPYKDMNSYIFEYIKELQTMF